MRGYHVYKDIWRAAVGEELEYIRERDNPRDVYAIAVVNTERLSAICREKFHPQHCSE